MAELESSTSSSKRALSPGWLRPAGVDSSVMGGFTQHWIETGLTLSFQALAIVLCAILALLAVQWSRNPSSPPPDRLGYFYIPYLSGLITLASGFWVVTRRRRGASGRAFGLFTAFATISLASFYDLQTTQMMRPYWMIFMLAAGGTLFDLGWVYPRQARLVKRFPFLRWSGLILAASLAVYLYGPIDKTSIPERVLILNLPAWIFLGVGAFSFLGRNIHQRLSSPSPLIREQSMVVLWGAALGFGPVLGFLSAKALQSDLVFNPYLLATISIFPFVTGYAILRYRLLNTDYLLSLGVVYALLSVIIVTAYVMLVGGASLIFGGAVPANNPLLTGILVLSLTLALNPLRSKLQGRVDRIFFKGDEAYTGQRQAFGRAISQATQQDDIVRNLRETINQALMPTNFHIFVYRGFGDHYAPTQDEDGRLTTDIRFLAKSALPQTLSRRKTSLFLGGGDSLPMGLVAERARLAILGTQLLVALHGHQHLVGWLALGYRRSGERYTNSDVEFLESMAEQAARAIERVQVVNDLERRVHEMDVLTRIADGINITLAFDDLLELIYTQTNQLIPSQDFKITLMDESGDKLYHAFYLEDDDRITSRENRSFTFGQSLESEVVKSQREIISADYEQECRSRGLVPETQGLYAWIGVPLNAGAETIGAVSLASRDPSVIFTQPQIHLFQAIADLVAGAIVKARLLEETEKSVRQMQTLNEIARSLTSNLELDPLLQEIMHSAVDILACESGSLLLVDENTGDAVFEVAVGPVGEELVGQRVPAGAGLVGKAVTSGEAVIQNDVRRSNEWFDTDKDTGYSTQDLLVVPMKVKDKVIGVLEVLNKKDRSPFTRSDQDLLAAFAAQAVVAIENARLYTLTDQALAARVEELSAMQRIDRELNASLDVDRAMRITLEWALRQSDADAGLVGEITGSGIRVMVTQGYQDELERYPDSILPVNQPVFEDAIENGQPDCQQIDEGDNFRLLASAQSQFIIPIRREAKTIGILFLESIHMDRCSPEVMAFLSRLSDHAAIAISNAQLYAAIQSASLAKSQFVSSAAHELKNPLTSIKGYTDLLVAGAVGEVSEAQANFLATIRSNAERMGTLVSDLQDLSRIEAGQLRLQFGKLSLTNVIEEVLRSLHRQIEEKGQTIDLEAPENLPPVWVDQVRLAQILTNLVSNAHKYTPQGGRVMILAERGTDLEEPQGGPQFVHIAVQDTGIGISPEDQRKIFQQFFRSEDPKVREVTGTGLGLSITKNLVEMQGGKIWFESQVDKGTTFHFTVPVAESD